MGTSHFSGVRMENFIPKNAKRLLAMRQKLDWTLLPAVWDLEGLVLEAGATVPEEKVRVPEGSKSGEDWQETTGLREQAVSSALKGG